MSFNYDLETDTGKVRLLISDQSETDHIYSDEEISTFLSMEENSVLKASALALESIAGNQALVKQRIRILDISTDGVAVSQELRQIAKSLREQAGTREDSFAIADIADDIFSIRDQRLKGRLNT